MADLETITLGELPTITEIGANDTVLIASGGRMKKASPSLVGGGGMTVFDLTETEVGESLVFSTTATTREIFDALPNVIFTMLFSEEGYTTHALCQVKSYEEGTNDYIVTVAIGTGGTVQSLYSTSENAIMTSEEPGGGDTPDIS